MLDERLGHRLLRRGKPRHLHPDRIRRLDDVDFQRSISKIRSLDFFVRIEQWKASRRCCIMSIATSPQKILDHMGQGNFRMEQRRRYKRFMAVETTFMNQERIDA